MAETPTEVVNEPQDMSAVESTVATADNLPDFGLGDIPTDKAELVLEEQNEPSESPGESAGEPDLQTSAEPSKERPGTPDAIIQRLRQEQSYNKEAIKNLKEAVERQSQELSNKLEQSFASLKQPTEKPEAEPEPDDLAEAISELEQSDEEYADKNQMLKLIKASMKKKVSIPNEFLETQKQLQEELMAAKEERAKLRASQEHQENAVAHKRSILDQHGWMTDSQYDQVLDHVIDAVDKEGLEGDERRGAAHILFKQAMNLAHRKSTAENGQDVKVPKNTRGAKILKGQGASASGRTSASPTQDIPRDEFGLPLALNEIVGSD